MMLPVPEIDAYYYPKGLRGKARYLEDRIAELEGLKAMVLRSGHRAIHQHLHVLRALLAWWGSQAGFVGGH